MEKTTNMNHQPSIGWFSGAWSYKKLLLKQEKLGVVKKKLANLAYVYIIYIYLIYL